MISQSNHTPALLGSQYMRQIYMYITPIKEKKNLRSETPRTSSGPRYVLVISDDQGPTKIELIIQIHHFNSTAIKWSPRKAV